MTPIEDITQLPTTVRYRRALAALAHILRNPEDTERVLEFTTLINAGGDPRRTDALFAEPAFRKLYAEQRALDSHTIDLAALAKLPPGTLGHAYATFMNKHQITPEVFDGTPQEIKDPRVAYIVQRLRQTHDLWHVVTNCETDPAGEIALQAFYYAQVQAPSSGVLAALGTLRTLPHTRRILRDVAVLYRRGATANKLALFAWEDHWNTPLVDVRRMLGLPANPAVTGGYLTALFEEHLREARAAA